MFTPGALGALYLGAAVLGPLLGSLGYVLVRAIWQEEPKAIRPVFSRRIGATPAAEP